MSGRGTPATLLLEREGVPHTVHAYELAAHAGSYGEAAAQALGVEPERMLKTLLASVAFSDGAARLVCGVVPVAGMCVGWPSERGYITPRLGLDATVHTDRYSEQPGCQIAHAKVEQERQQKLK